MLCVGPSPHSVIDVNIHIGDPMTGVVSFLSLLRAFVRDHELRSAKKYKDKCTTPQVRMRGHFYNSQREP